MPVTFREDVKMKRYLVAAGLIALAGEAFADPVEGMWKTAPDDNGNWGYIQVAPCADKICGTLVKSFNPDGSVYDSPNIGKLIIWDMVPNGEGAYKGQIWSPDADKVYKSKMTLAGDKLAVEGCVLFVCRDGGTWVRLK